MSRELDLSTAEVYGTATFYSFLDTTRRGKYIIRICKTIVCDMHGKNQIVKTLEEQLKIKVGETTHNHKFSLLETNCLGWCHKGPAMLINDEVYTDLTPERIRQIIADYRNR
jgi:NADH:ubiquinone oxidoreductase subunit E